MIFHLLSTLGFSLHFQSLSFRLFERLFTVLMFLLQTFMSMFHVKLLQAKLFCSGLSVFVLQHELGKIQFIGIIQSQPARESHEASRT